MCIISTDYSGNLNIQMTEFQNQFYSTHENICLAFWSSLEYLKEKIAN